MTKVMLRDMPGIPRFAEQLTKSVAELSLAMAGEDEEQAQATLEQTRRNLSTKLTAVIGAKTATEIAEAFTSAVMARKRQIEAGRHE
jgi:hypothetical protein